MNTTEAIRARRSVRKFKPDTEIPQADLDLMLEAAMCAPSAMNKRPWSFIVIQNPGIRDEITQGIGGNWFISHASAAILVCGNPGVASGAPTEGFWSQDCAAAAQNLMLQATELGYGTCWCGVYPGKRTPIITKILDLQDVIPLSLIAVGIPDETPSPKGGYDETKVRYIK